jgi:hypothetical protein
MPLKIARQSLGGWPPFGLGCQSSWRMGWMRAQSSSLTSQMVAKGFGWERVRGMAGFLREFLLFHRKPSQSARSVLR